MINDAFARRFFPGRNPLGGTVTIKPERVGVVPTQNRRRVTGTPCSSPCATFAVRPIMYLPLAQIVESAPLGSVRIS